MCSIISPVILLGLFIYKGENRDKPNNHAINTKIDIQIIKKASLDYGNIGVRSEICLKKRIIIKRCSILK